MKLRKQNIFALIESILFLIGAFFLAKLFLDPDIPLWALWTGLAFAGAGVLLWLVPVIKRLLPAKTPKEVTSLPSTTAKTTDASQNSYELHRPTFDVNPPVNA